ncbi:MAG TPA: hypothetical protein DCX06_05490, partial [Opitutae bacterium]|nr:hypothetical protein [Opitutae bacterium]
MGSIPNPTQSPKNINTEAAENLFLSEFRAPGAALRGKPFWSWNGQLEESELLRQIDVVDQMGMGGVFMHSRTGLQTEYLGEEWFELINSCAEKCAETGLEGWLYDEDRWPSGTAGGIVTTDEQHRMRSIVLREYGAGERIAWPEEADFIEAHIVELKALHLFAYEPIERGALAECPQGKQVLVFYREVHPSNSFYNGGAYLDTLSRDATNAFIESTHEKYREHCGHHFGKSIQGIFTDEPHRGFILCDAVQQPGASKPSHSIPYTESLFDEFEAQFGQSLRGRLPELIFQYKGQPLSKLKWQYVELLQRLFIQNWAKPCADWCESNDLLLTGHVLHEDSLAAQVVPVGSLFRYYETMSYPGIDVLSKRCESFWVAKQVVSTARQLGKPYALSELYGCTGWDMGFDGHKRIGDWQAFQGINLRCHHLSWYSMAGESKRDYPASILHQSAWYSDYKYVEDYFARVNHVLKQGEPDCDVLVVHPGESLWAQFHLGWSKWLGSDSAQIDAIEEKFATLYRWLMDAQIDFDYGDEEQMDRLGEIEVIDDEVFFRVGEMRYRSIVLGGMDTMRGSTLKLLKAFTAAGGSVVFAGPVPAYVDAELSEAPLAYAGVIGSSGWSQSSIVMAIRSASEQLLKLNRNEGVPGVMSHVRRVENGEVLVALVNTTEAMIQNVYVNLAAVGHVDCLNCRDGSMTPVDARASADGLQWPLHFEPLQEHVFRVRVNSTSIQGSAVAMKSSATQSVMLNGVFDYELSEPNALVLDRARYRIADGAWRAEEDILRIDKEVREASGWPLRTGTMVQPWCSHGEADVGPDFELEYRFEVDVIPPELDLVLEQPERWELFLNDQAIPLNHPLDWMVDIALKRTQLPTQALQVGMNFLRLRTKLKSDTDLEALYLFGDFGVERRASGFVLTHMPIFLEIGDLVDQGLPFYSGRVSYLTKLKDIARDQAFICQLPNFEGACATVVCGDTEQLYAFPPYTAELTALSNEPLLRIEVCLTRQNLFGPFHRIPKESIMTAPDSFRTVGECYTEDYLFFPSGLIEAPV